MKKYLYLAIAIAFCQSLDAQCWNLVWEDNFDGTSVDWTKWEAQTGAGGWGNNELQHYTARTDNATVSGGSLKIIAKEESYSGANYTSARLRTKDLGDWTYGRIEARIKQPIGQGIWPAFWMLPTDNLYGTWPASGEIDVMEYLGHQPSTSYGTAHWGTNPPFVHQYMGSSCIKPSGTYNDDFSVYSVEWTASEIRWYVDGMQYHSLVLGDVSPYHWPFDQRFHLLLNLAVGGNWPGAPDATTMFPQEMEVDYVRVYQEVADIAIAGDAKVIPCTSATYKLPTLSGTTYTWVLPDGATLIAGAGTAEITVDWSHLSGTIQAMMSTACGSTTVDFPVEVTRNRLSNPSFEQDLSAWSLNAYNGGAATSSIITSDVQEGSKAVCMDVTALGANSWEVQLSYASLDLIAGKDYSLRFWAKSSTAAKQVRANIINSTTYAPYAAQTYTLSNQWTEYVISFNAPATVNTLLTFDMGFEIGEVCFEIGEVCLDNVQFSETVAPLLLRPKVYLQGAYDNMTNLMTDALRMNNLVPITEPFTAAGFVHIADGGGEATTTTVLNTTGTNAVVDWVLIELRDKTDASKVLATRAALLQRDGDIVDIDGVSDVGFDVCPDEYYVAVRHRNHLGVMSSTSLLLD